MESESNHNVGRSELSGEFSVVSAPWETDLAPVVTRPGAGPASTMVTRLRAREGRRPNMSVDPEVEFRPEMEARLKRNAGSYFRCVRNGVRSVYVPIANMFLFNEVFVSCRL